MRYNYDIPMRRFYPEHTIWRVSQLSAHHTGISVVPEVITDGAPSTIDTHLHPSSLCIYTTRESNVSIGADYYRYKMKSMNALKADSILKLWNHHRVHLLSIYSHNTIH